MKSLLKKIIGRHSAERILVASDFLSMTGALLVTLIVPVFTIPYLIRTLGIERFGLISFAGAFVQYFGILIDYGFNFSSNRQVSLALHEPTRISRIANAVLWIRIFLFIVGYITLAFLVFLIPRFRLESTFYLLSYGVLLTNTLVPSYLFQGASRMKYVLLCQLTAIPTAVGYFLFVKSPGDYLGVPVLQLAGAGLSGIIGITIAAAKFGLRLELPCGKELKRQWSEGWHVFISNVAGATYNNTRVFALGLFASNQVTGYYAIAERMANLIMGFPLYTFLQSVYPFLNRCYQQSSKLAESYVDRFQRVATIGYACLLTLFYVFAPVCVRTFAGGDYADVISHFRILTLAIFSAAAVAFKLHAFLVFNRADLFARVNMICGFFGPFVTFFAAYVFSAPGVAASYVFMNLMGTFLTLREYKKLAGEQARED